MARQRKSKRQLVRDEKRKKKRDRGLAAEDEAREAKRRRVSEADEGAELEEADHFDHIGDQERRHQKGSDPEREYFGTLADEEQEYFRGADELLELNDFPSPSDRAIFLANVYKEAQGKELKLASSQSCSRLMERLILLATSRQKKRLFQAFTGHYLTLVTHRFASHCCEQLFMQSAPIITKELGGGHLTDDETDDTAADEASSQHSMEELFLLMLDELEQHLAYLLSDKFASHTMRVILMVLSGRPFGPVSTKSLLQSKKKEQIKVPGVSLDDEGSSSQVRAVPESFTLAIQKIIGDSTSAMDATALRILATHPTGNPALQLLLELDIALNTKSKSAGQDGQRIPETLLERLLPGAPNTLNDADSPTSVFVNSMVYDPIGSRLLETLITHCPGKIFKGLYANTFGPRIQTFLRNDVACYPAIRVLNRLGKEDLVDAVRKSLPTVPVLVEKRRFSVLKALFQRCHVRHADGELDSLLQAIYDAYESDATCLVCRFCLLDEELRQEDEGVPPHQLAKMRPGIVSHGSQLAVALLGIPGAPSDAIQASLLSLPPDKAMSLATSSTPTANIFLNALKTPSRNAIFHKSLVALFLPRIMDLAASQFGHNVLNAIITTPSKGEGIAVPFHLKEVIVTQLSEHEKELRDSWTGRSVWRTWRGDLWKHRRTEWIRWAKEVDPEAARVAQTPKPGAAQRFRSRAGQIDRDSIKATPRKAEAT